MNAAAQIQGERRAHERETHEARLAWLAGPAPCWSCGTPVSAADRDSLARASREHLALLDRMEAGHG